MTPLAGGTKRRQRDRPYRTGKRFVEWCDDGQLVRSNAGPRERHGGQFAFMVVVDIARVLLRVLGEVLCGNLVIFRNSLAAYYGNGVCLLTLMAWEPVQLSLGVGEFCYAINNHGHLSEEVKIPRLPSHVIPETDRSLLNPSDHVQYASSATEADEPEKVSGERLSGQPYSDSCPFSTSVHARGKRREIFKSGFRAGRG
ncbi:hypothetical protein CCHR01_14246 [Colletotrichum chrysophilum]|uniref:Uncharacterized protein n=1 Tax=Colletotrichum chrysophilum TaxID=1836956 RepID=A0AAD9A8Y5_9PEZI|nr:hypothetical protein CCHR01_14246 [Colletotrichum chrysophilum]